MNAEKGDTKYKKTQDKILERNRVPVFLSEVIIKHLRNDVSINLDVDGSLYKTTITLSVSFCDLIRILSEYPIDDKIFLEEETKHLVSTSSSL